MKEKGKGKAVLTLEDECRIEAEMYDRYARWQQERQQVLAEESIAAQQELAAARPARRPTLLEKARKFVDDLVKDLVKEISQ